MLLRAPGREGRNRRLKKDAQSLFSLEIPSFDEKTGLLGSECIFPRSLAVDVAIENVLSQERGELRTKVSGVGIRRFLTEFQESRKIIYVYFWYIIAHIRRIHAEKTLIGRYVNLERVVRGAFPRYKAELLPIDQLEWILAKSVYSSPKLTRDSTTMLQEVVEEVPSFVPAVSNLPPRPRGSITVTDDGARTSHPTQSGRKSYQRSSRISMSNISVMEAASEKLLQDPNTLWRCTDAINAFRIIQLEVYELAEFAQRCFHRLAILFGQAFERLAEGKDDVMTAFMFIVPHVVYYVFVYCFPNDVVAGLFNAAMRVNLYRIFYFWCSGLVATYVRVNGWPRPPAAGKGVPLKSVERYAATPSVSQSTLALATLLSSKLSASPSDPREEVNSETLPPLLANFSNSPLCAALSGERVLALDDDSFENVDVEVANGHHRLMLEFRRYAKHVNYLLRELAERTEGMHRELARGSTSPPPTETGDNFVREVAAVERTGVQCPLAEKRAFFQDSTAPLSEGPMKSKSQESSQISKMLPSLAPHHRNNIDAARADNVERGLPAILPTFNTAKTRKATSTNSDCILSGFPLDRMAPHVKQYILHSTGEPVVKVPLPPLDGDLSTDDICGKEVTPSLVDRRPAMLCSRTVKMPLPFTSPFFQYYAGERLCANAMGDNNKAAAKVTTHGASNFIFPPSSLQTAGSSQDSVNSRTAVAPTSLTEALPRITTRKPSLPPTHGVSKSNNDNNISKSSNTKLMPLMFPHSTQKVINVMRIPLSNTHLRPLQFKNLTKEVARRQLAMERKMDFLSEREQVLRQQYIAESQQGIRRVHTLLAECRSDRLEMEVQRGLSNVKMKKSSLIKRRKQTRLEAINR
ncbi:hypothetical protein TRSC58_01256 [Trypanosoma rangeli SC58]|uniref:Uncharacterized protein n=1 Tax=Trypanosoma rangeli SC58 TaxID=429131 RepID=A0A061J6G0_TRYRA|nr:hypothetical protein TRSC58_01256 [Trypanosoma rangeli SC58]